MTASYLERSLSDYLADASAGRPTPGGGSVAALAGALAMSMAEMALNFTVGKKKFQAVEDEARKLLDAVSCCRRKCVELVDRDVASYAVVSAAYALPKSTDEEAGKRTAAIQAALRVAMEPPLETFRALADVFPALARCVQVANPNLVSDVGVSAVIARSALLAARLNVEINLVSLKDPALVASIRDEMERASDEAVRLADETHRLVTCRIAGGD
ncbi:MAG: cyclodeaminase/cyclohydrolase family protein [Planctomycetota bacterium]